MKIVQLNAENIKRLTAVEIRPDGNLVAITGRNGQGKTSVLDAIWWCLDGGKQIQKKPVRDGAESGQITIDLGEYKVTRKFKVKEDNTFTTSLTVQNSDGFKANSPQEVLDKFIGDLSFDPLAFSRMKPADQVRALQSLVPDFDFADADRLNKIDFEARTEHNRNIKALRANIDAIVVPVDAPTERVSTEALMDEMQKAMDENTALQQQRSRLQSLTLQRESTRDAIGELGEEKKKIERRIADLELKVEELDDQIGDIGDVAEPVDLEPVKRKIADSEEMNRQFAARERKAGLLEEVKALEERSEAHTKAIAARKEAATKAVAAANIPVPGLTLSEDAVLLDGQPFEQASDAQQLRASLAIAGAMNPRLRVIRVRQGSLLDDEAMRSLETYANEHDLQIWIERVDSSGKVGVVIEDGAVAHIASEAAE